MEPKENGTVPKPANSIASNRVSAVEDEDKEMRTRLKTFRSQKQVNQPKSAQQVASKPPPILVPMATTIPAKRAIGTTHVEQPANSAANLCGGQKSNLKVELAQWTLLNCKMRRHIEELEAETKSRLERLFGEAERRQESSHRCKLLELETEFVQSVLPYTACVPLLEEVVEAINGIRVPLEQLIERILLLSLSIPSSLVKVDNLEKIVGAIREIEALCLAHRHQFASHTDMTKLVNDLNGLLVEIKAKLKTSLQLKENLDNMTILEGIPNC